VEDSALGVESDLQDSQVPPPRNDSAVRRSKKATNLDSDEALVFMWSEFLFKRVFKAEDSGNLRQTGDHWPFVLAKASPLLHARVPYDITYRNYLGEERMARVPKAMVSLRKKLIVIRWWCRKTARGLSSDTCAKVWKPNCRALVKRGKQPFWLYLEMRA
jgi:hypothetical protein